MFIAADPFSLYVFLTPLPSGRTSILLFLPWGNSFIELYPTGLLLLSRKQIDGSKRASPFDGPDHSPLERDSQKPSRSLSLSKGRRRWWGDFNALPYASSMIEHVRILRGSLAVRIYTCTLA